MRCIETVQAVGYGSRKSTINYNMRCIETQRIEEIYLLAY